MKRGTPRHPKTKHLARLLKIKLYSAVGLLEMLWHFVGDFAPAGDIGRVSNADIADGVAWEKDPEVLITALIESRWLDPNQKHRLIVHDWSEHADDAVRKKLKRSSAVFLPEYGRCPDAVETTSGQSPPIESDAVGHTRAEGQGKAGQGEAVVGFEEGVLGGEAVVPVVHPKALADVDFRDLVGAWVSLGMPLSESDISKCAMLWIQLDIDAKRAALEDVQQKANGEWRTRAVKYLTRPWNYLSERQWERRAIVNGRQRSMTKGEEASAEARRRFHEYKQSQT